MQATRTIGIIACSAEGAALCYRTICSEAPARLGPHAHPEIIMHTPSLALYVAALQRGDLPAVADLIARSADILAGAGAQVLICPDNTIHQALPAQLPLPFIHIAEAVGEAARDRGMKRVLILGTRWLMESSVYSHALATKGIETVSPAPDERARLDAIIMDELVPGRIEPASRRAVEAMVAAAAATGCDGAVLGCTELPLLFGEEAGELALLDSTRILARRALHVALS